MATAKTLRVHEHAFIGGPRAHRSGKGWPEGMGPDLVHSHEGGDLPHSHPDTGPASFTLGKPQMTARPNGDQLPYIKTDPKDLVFDVFVMDSALVPDGHGQLRPIRPDDEIGLPLQASLVERKFGMTARVHDLRTRKASGR